MKYFYAVEHGDDYSNDTGSTVKREARKMATALHREFPGEEIRITKVDESGEFCAQWTIYKGILPGQHRAWIGGWTRETETRMKYGQITLKDRVLPVYNKRTGKWSQEATDENGNPVLIVTDRWLTSVRVTRPR